MEFESVVALVVDGDAHSLNVISNLLRELGIRFKRNTTGAHVVRQALKMSPPPNVILMAADLPFGNPLQIVRELAATPELARVPVIIIANNQHELMGLQSPLFTALLTRPLPRQRMPRVLRQVLQGERVFFASA